MSDHVCLSLGHITIPYPFRYILLHLYKHKVGLWCLTIFLYLPESVPIFLYLSRFCYQLLTIKTIHVWKLVSYSIVCRPCIQNIPLMFSNPFVLAVLNCMLKVRKCVYMFYQHHFFIWTKNNLGLINCVNFIPIIHQHFVKGIHYSKVELKDITAPHCSFNNHTYELNVIIYKLDD
jgi:hypothetical protein